MTLCFYSEAPISENTREKNAILRWDSGNVNLAGQSQPVSIWQGKKKPWAGVCG